MSAKSGVALERQAKEKNKKGSGLVFRSCREILIFLGSEKFTVAFTV